MASSFVLHSTKHSQPPVAPASPAPLPLAPGWTEHKAPTGHTYYYNAETRTSTYNRPIAAPAVPVPEPTYLPSGLIDNSNFAPAPANFPFAPSRQAYVPPEDYQSRRPRQQIQPKPDTPKTKREISGSSWLLVTTKKGFRFVHNLETKESLWDPPDELQALLDGMKILTIQEEREQERIRRRRKALQKIRDEEEQAAQDDMVEPTDVEPGASGAVKGTKRPIATEAGGEEEEEGDDYEDDDYDDEEHDEKRVKTDAVEFDEDDIAWQLGAMAEEYGLEDEDMEGGDLPAEDAAVIFKEMLDEYEVNPYSTWEKEMPRFVDDGRYTVLPTTKRRKEVFGDWSRIRMAELKVEKEKQVKIDPRISYLLFLEENATPKLYWPEFKRKFKKSPEMKDPKVTDKEREKYFRDYISRMRISQETKENDLKKLLRSTQGLTRNTSFMTLPPSISCDIRFVSLSREVREQILADHARTLPEVIDVEDEAEREREKEEERKAQALEDRERAVRKEQSRLKWEAERGREALRGSEMEVERAMRVGKGGLLSHLTLNEKGDEAPTEREKEAGEV